MLFTSLTYFLFLPLALFFYYILPAKFRKYFLIAVSAFFYMCVKVEYIFIVLLVIIVNFGIGLNLETLKNIKSKRILLYTGLFINIGILFIFKYWNFTIDNIFNLLGWFNLKIEIPLLDVLLPLGLSYYIFQTIGYIVDIYRSSIKAEKNIANFTLFVLFFPKLLVGPIERANRFLPQISKYIYYHQDNIIEGSKRIAWGLFKKLVVADRIAIFQSSIFAHVRDQSAGTLLFASILYTFQVYADFSGYTDIALGSARLFGIDLMENFRRPLLAKNISDFWRRWHISLSSWVNDYIFNPIALKYRALGNWSIVYALFISFIVIGIWHGAAWNYVFFGVLQAMALVYEANTKRFRRKISKKVPSGVYNITSILVTFLFVTFSLIIFRSGTISEAMVTIRGIFSNHGVFFYEKPSTLLFMLIGCGIMLVYDIQEEYKIFRFSFFSNKNWVIQEISYAFLLIYILLAGVFDGGQFIYFSF
jgi:alginate O-acetyltransferase complex protein AlgI